MWQYERYKIIARINNIAILGRVFVGKSTLFNSLFIEQYSDMSYKRTTKITQT